MIDKLELRIPCDTPFHQEFSRLYCELRADPTKDPFHPSRHYLLVADLRPFGFSAILHQSCKWGRYGNHKLELLDTGEMSFSRMICEAERIFEMDASKREVMRLDLAADVPGVPVTWFQARIKANHKHYIANFGNSEFVEMGKSGIQTLYFGKRPNLFRIYDKIAEYRHQYKRDIRNLTAALAVPSFEEKFGFTESDVLTRVERQIGGGKIPEQFEKVSGLKNIENFRPFENLKLVIGGDPEPNPENYSFMEYCTGMFLREKAEREGMHSVYKFIARVSKRNTKWAFEKFKDFMPEEHSEKYVNTDYLNELFRESVSKQLAA